MSRGVGSFPSSVVRAEAWAAGRVGTGAGLGEGWPRLGAGCGGDLMIMRPRGPESQSRTGEELEAGGCFKGVRLTCFPGAFYFLRMRNICH